METYIDVFLNTDGEKASVIQKKLIELGLKPSVGDHDYIFDWNGIVEVPDIVTFADKIQTSLKNTGAILKFKTIR